MGCVFLYPLAKNVLSYTKKSGFVGEFSLLWVRAQC